MNPMINSVLSVEKKIELERQLQQTDRQRQYDVNVYMREAMPLQASLGKLILTWLTKFRRKPRQITHGYSLEVEC